MKKLFLLLTLLILTTQVGAAQAPMTDYEAIHNLVASERLYRVEHRNDALAKCYAENAQIHTSWQRGSTASFVGQGPVESKGSKLPTASSCNPPVIHFSEVSPSKALVEYPMLTVRGVKVNGVDAVLTSFMRLVYRVEKQGDAWKIIAMTSINESDQLATVIPGEDSHINPQDIQKLRVSYRWLSYARIKAGGKVNPDELGTDRPEELKEFYQQEFAWLNSK